MIGNIDDVIDVDGGLCPLQVARGGFALVRGWALSTNPVQPLTDLAIGFDGAVPTEVTLGLRRDDLREAFGVGGQDGGFVVAIPTLAPLGDAAIVIRANAGEQAVTIRTATAVAIEPPLDPFADSPQRSGDWFHAIDGMFIGDNLQAAVDSDGTYIVAPEHPARLRLWVVDAETPRRAARTIIARVGGRYVPVISGLHRPDVALFLDEPLATDCGAWLPIAPGPIGIEEVTIYAVREDGSYAKVFAVRVRQPDPLSSDVLPTDAAIVGALDEMVIGNRRVDFTSPVAVRADDSIWVRGWAIDEVGPRNIGGIEILIDGTMVASGQSDRHRSDIISRFGGSVADCEFAFDFRLPALPPGAHVLVVRALSARRDGQADLLRTMLTA